jgi:hypothetical protein
LLKLIDAEQGFNTCGMTGARAKTNIFLGCGKERDITIYLWKLGCE